ncbi:MAG: acyl-CoA desaturase [Parvularculaceae bacterium]
MRNSEQPAFKFAADGAFRRTLAGRVDAYFEKTRKRRTDAPAFYIKAALLAAWTAASYVLLVFAPATVAEALFLAVSLGLSSILMAFNVYHDASHGAASTNPIINRIGLLMMDAAGVSSYVWTRKHNGMHHVFPNVHGYDCDLDAGPIARFAVQQERRPHHRLQPLYLWFAYGLYAFKWQWFDDFRPLFERRIGETRFQRPRGFDAVQFLLGKIVFFALAFAIPATRHDPLTVLAFYFLVYYVNGLVFVAVVMAAHVCESAATPDGEAVRGKGDWARHQAEVTSDFAHDDRVLSWCLGGLNFHVEHHLFPRICHVRYPDIAPIVRATCEEFGVPYNYTPSFAGALASHHRRLSALARD